MTTIIGQAGQRSEKEPTNLELINDAWKPYIDDDEGNEHRERLGVYRGSQPRIYQNRPVIYSTQSSVRLSAATANQSPLSALAPRGSETTFLKIYGDLNTGKPSSWEVYVLKGTGKYNPDNNMEILEWQLAPNVREAQALPGFQECLSNYKTSHPMIPVFRNP